MKSQNFQIGRPRKIRRETGCLYLFMIHNSSPPVYVCNVNSLFALFCQLTLTIIIFMNLKTLKYIMNNNRQFPKNDYKSTMIALENELDKKESIILSQNHTIRSLIINNSKLRQDIKERAEYIDSIASDKLNYRMIMENQALIIVMYQDEINNLRSEFKNLSEYNTLIKKENHIMREKITKYIQKIFSLQK